MFFLPFFDFTIYVESGPLGQIWHIIFGVGSNLFFQN